MDAATRVRPPSSVLLALEIRAIAELQAFFAAYPALRSLPRGDGHPVLVFPGLAASDRSTRPLRSFLKELGYAAHGWKLGSNRGPRQGVEAGMESRLAELAERYGRKVSLIGWSLGGVYARELARRTPDQVRQVITLGSPIAGEPKATNASRLYEVLSGRSADDHPWLENMKRPPPVPSTAIYSRTDGIVAWQACLEQESTTTQNIEVEGSHCGLGHNPMALYAIADRLALPENEWWPFDRGGLRAALYPDPKREVGAGPNLGDAAAWLSGLKYIVERIKTPSVDLATLIDSAQRDMKALGEANLHVDGEIGTSFERRNEILSDALAEWHSAIRDILSGGPTLRIAEDVGQSIQSAIESFRGLAVTEAEVRQKAWAIVLDRLRENVAYLQRLLKPIQSLP